MQRKSHNTLLFLFMLVAGIITLSCCTLLAGNIFSKPEKTKTSSEPTLYIALPDSNSVEIFTADFNTISWAISDKLADADSPAEARLNLVVATHGWYEKTTWPKDLVLAIKKKTDAKQWLCGWYDWRTKAKVINPIDAAKYGRDTAGPMLGKKIVQLSKNWQHIHLIGHSAGAWVVSEAAKLIAKETNATIHLTFLDAYVPLFWAEGQLGDFHGEPNTLYWADHYFTRDITLTTTEKRLTNAHNVELTKVTPGINDHKFPHYWYHATVIGQYATGQRYEGKELFNTVDDLQYGFPRALEAGAEKFEANTALEQGNKPVEIKRPKKSIISWLKEFFKKRPK